MLSSSFKRWICATIVFTGACGAARAQAPQSADQQTLQALQALQQRLDQLERQNRELQDTVRNLQSAPAQPTISFQPAARDGAEGSGSDAIEPTRPPDPSWASTLDHSGNVDLSTPTEPGGYLPWLQQD